ncbi:phosphodiester glycosidase family protein [Salegentibacter maritimus]|uniref:Phosphodiester glycosidase family protein n=1 Tax=Salegentibacter maritimus TaxID=2794347 RepID=A0ABS0TGW0_9FLAO|nr:phosphodiester glycosidase family protein [Salegentibacter maritimus]MBI6120299.1 phosphodiester glycosidase family protein [Salegentibacter maritimus]
MKLTKIFINILGLLLIFPLQSQEINLNWQPREDLNINLPASIKIFDAFGKLPDNKPVRAMYAIIDLRDTNLKLRSLGSNTIRETTKETYKRGNGILAINGGYFAANSSVSTIIQDGEVIAPGPNTEIARGAFGIKNNKPEVAWVNSGNNNIPMKFASPDINSKSEIWNVSQAVGGGPVLLKNGKINVTDKEEGFTGSHLMRHPRTAIGYKNKHSLIMMVVDGRQEASVGVSLEELAQLMLEVGAKEAVNLDGGGSSAMIAANEVVNIPTDITGGNRNSLRKNAGALVISETQVSTRTQPIIFDTEDSNFSQAGIWSTSNQVNYYGESASRQATSNKINKAFYTFKGIARNNYQLASWFTVNSQKNSEQVLYILHREAKTDTLSINQKSLKNVGKWNVLGNFEIGPKDSLEIVGASEGKFTVDAIRLVAKKDSPVLPKRGDFRIAVISDLNSGLGAANYEWQVDSIINRIPKIWQPDLVICGGDMVAGMGISKTTQLQKMWDGFDGHIMAPLHKAKIPFAFTLGNHDGPRNYTIEHNFAKKFWNKNIYKTGLQFVDATNFPNYYSFVAKNNFFVSWEASSSKITKENLEWLKEQFKTPEAKKSTYRFVIGHMPLYSVAQERDSKGNVLENAKELQKLLEKYEVHTYISGHQHAYYPGKRGKLQLLNTGAAGSGPRSWLTQSKKPVNAITIMDIFNSKDSIIYSTYDIKKKQAAAMPLFDEKTLPAAMIGVNGYVMRRDIVKSQKFKAYLSSLNTKTADIDGLAEVKAKIENNKLKIMGNYFNVASEFSNSSPIKIYKGRHTEDGELLKEIKLKSPSTKNGTFSTHLKLTEEIRSYLSFGGIYIQINTKTGSLRSQLLPVQNKAPQAAQIVSHYPKNTYGIRNIDALYEIKWSPAIDQDGDFVSYIYQVSPTEDFSKIILQKKTGRETSLKMTEKQWFKLLGDSNIGQQLSFYHRILATDGSNFSYASPTPLNLMKSQEALDDLAQIPAANYVFKGKLDATGAGYGAEWDGEGKLWLADYNKGLIIKNTNNKETDFSPLTSVKINGEEFNLSPVNGIGIDLDGNILAGINRRLIKINATTGKGIAVWEAPKGARAITAPRASENGEIYAMSLFGDDPNYILKQQGNTFKLIRTIELKGRNLARTFDMTKDGKTLFFPDPGSPKIQVYSSENSKDYTKQENITSISAGSSAIQVVNDAIYTAVRSSGISPSSIHYRNEEKQEMWTLELPEVNGAEPRGIGVSKDGNTIIFCSWDKGGGYYLYERENQ